MRFVLIGVAVWLAAATAWAEGGDARRGEELAAAWCADCHIVAPGRQTVASDAAPTFNEIASDPKRTDARIRAFLQEPHAPMPKLQLSRPEIDDFLAFLRSLEE